MLCVQVFIKTLNLETSCCCFADQDKEMQLIACHTCCKIIFLCSTHEIIVFLHPHEFSLANWETTKFNKSNSNQEMLFFGQRETLEYPQQKLLQQRTSKLHLNKALSPESHSGASTLHSAVLIIHLKFLQENSTSVINCSLPWGTHL